MQIKFSPHAASSGEIQHPGLPYVTRHSWPRTRCLAALLARLGPLLDYALPRYALEGKAYLTMALGCTGGRHRSVALAEELGRQLKGKHEVVISHRDVERAGS